jgi:hypothetical protein
MNSIIDCTQEILYFYIVYTQTLRINNVILKSNLLLGVNSKFIQEKWKRAIPLQVVPCENKRTDLKKIVRNKQFTADLIKLL